MISLLRVLFAIAVLTIAGCANEQPRPVATGSSPTATDPRSLSAGPVASGPAGPIYVLINGRKYEPKSGRIRADLLDIERLQLQTRKAEQSRQGTWRAEPAVYTLPTTSVEKGVLLRFPANAASTWVGDSDHPACYTSYVSVYTAVGAMPSPRPFSFPTPSPGQDGRLSTPVPTPVNRPYVRLSSEGLLEAGWPRIFWDAAIVELDATVYRLTASGYLDFGTADTSIPTRLLSPVGTTTIEYAVHPELPVGVQPLLKGAPVIDRVAIYRPSDRLASEVIVVDPCPRESAPDEFVYCEAMTESSGALGEGSATPASTTGSASPAGPPNATLTPAPTATPAPTPIPGPRGVTRHFDTGWSSDRDSYLPGEPISVKFVLRSVWDKVLTVKAFPEKVALRADGAQEEIALTKGIGGAIPQKIQPYEEVEVSIEIPSSLSKTLIPGKYWVHLEGRFTDEASQGGFTIGWSNDLLFVVQHPQGAMNGTVTIDEARDNHSLRVTLESIEFTPAKTTIVALAVPRDYKSTEGLGPGGAPHGATAFYRVDGEPWQELRGLGNRETAEGVRLEWTLGPTRADAKTFGLLVTSFMVNPSVTVTGVWLWSVPLQTPATPTPRPIPAGVITPQVLWMTNLWSEQLRVSMTYSSAQPPPFQSDSKHLSEPSRIGLVRPGAQTRLPFWWGTTGPPDEFGDDSLYHILATREDGEAVFCRDATYGTLRDEGLAISLGPDSAWSLPAGRLLPTVAPTHIATPGTSGPTP